MFKRLVGAVVVLVAVSVAAVVFSPALRAQVSDQWARLGGWTEDARQADPVGFTTYAERKLQRDLEVMQRTRRELAAELGQLANKLREQQGLGDQARQLADEFRAGYQQASVSGSFPIAVRGAAYTKVQAESQVSMLLAEADGYEAATNALKEVQQEAGSQTEALAVRINATEAQLAALSTKRELLRARQLSEEGKQLLAQVDELLSGNAKLIEGNPVRTVRELLDGPVERSEKTASEKRVGDFLAAKPRASQEATIQVVVPAVATEQVSVEKSSAKPKKRAKRSNPSKPIFQQF